MDRERQDDIAIKTLMLRVMKEFTAAMESRITIMAREEFYGDRKPGEDDHRNLYDVIKKQSSLFEGQEVDVAIYAMIQWYVHKCLKRPIH